jgi:fluoroquinolone transport system permease protein
MKRLLATLRRDLTLQARYRLYAVSVFIVLFWGVFLNLLPATAQADAAAVVPAFVMVNLILTTFYFVGALVLLERDEGMLAALVTTPLRDLEYVLAKVLTLAALALAETLLVVGLVFGLRFRWGLLLGGTALLGALYVLAGFASVVRHRAINAWLMPSVGVVTLLSLPLLPHFGLAEPALFYWHPAMPALVLLQAGCAAQPAPGVALLYGVLGACAWVGLGFAWARRRFDRFVVRTAGD